MGATDRAIVLEADRLPTKLLPPTKLVGDGAKASVVAVTTARETISVVGLMLALFGLLCWRSILISTRDEPQYKSNCRD